MGSRWPMPAGRREYPPRSFCRARSLLTSSPSSRGGAQVKVSGEVWDDSNMAALRHAEAEALAYIHPFADRAVIAGQGTIALEVLEEARDLDTLILAIGGGGLISGIAIAARAVRPGIRIIGVDPAGDRKSVG